MPETLPPPPKAVPLGKVASPQAMTEGVISGQPALRFSLKLSRHAKGPILEGAVAEGDWGSLLPWLTPSVKAFGFATFPKGTALAVAANFAATPKGAPLGELASVARLRGYPPRDCFRRKQARQLPFPALSPPVKMQCRSVRRRSGIAL